MPSIGAVKRLDQKNRLHIPLELLKRAGIEENSEVLLAFDFGDDCIRIYPLRKAETDEAAEKMKNGGSKK